MNSDPLSESNTRSGNGNMPSRAATALTIHLDALLRIDAFSVHPVTRSVIVRVRVNSPTNVGPQCATVSASITPGVVAVSSPTLLNPIELRSNGDSLVVLMPRSCIDLRAGARYRSIVAALIACNSVTASAVANGLSRSPASASRGSHRPRITTRYFTHGQPINAHTCSNSDRESLSLIHISEPTR